MEDCLFCKIAKGEIPSTKVYEDDFVFGFCDIAPQAPYHYVFIPKQHITSAAEIDEGNSDVVAKIFTAMAKVAKEKKFTKGYRIVSNIGKDGGQTVLHLHFHLTAGRPFTWPAG